MSKYSFEFKKKVVKEYLYGKCGYKYLAQKHNIPSQSNVEKWVHSYQEFVDEGIMSSRKNYSFQFKLSVVELYLSSEVSYQELAL